MLEIAVGLTQKCLNRRESLETIESEDEKTEMKRTAQVEREERERKPVD